MLHPALIECAIFVLACIVFGFIEGIRDSTGRSSHHPHETHKTNRLRNNGYGLNH